MKAFLILSVLFFVLGCGRNELVQAPPATDGVDVGNGGDTFAGEFVEIAYELAELIIQQPMPGLTAEELLRAVRTTNVVSAETLKLDGKPIDALNFPRAHPPRIEVSRTAWKRMSGERHQKVFLALHEYLGILGKDDTNYQISRRLDRSGVCERTPAIRAFLENEVRKSCYRIAIDDLRFIYTMDLPHKGIMSLKPGDFDHLLQLKTINLFDNELKSVPKGMFRDLSVLETLNLAHNKISELDSHAFQGLTSLRGLNLNGNALKRLPSFAFDGLRAKRVGVVIDDRQTYIDLGMNSFESLDAGALQGLEAEEILLDTFKVLEAGSFEGTPATKWLHFSIDASEGSISPDAFKGLGEVAEVSVDVQWPDKLSLSFFAPLVGVKSLKLASWKTAFSLEQIGALDKLPALESIHLSSYLIESKVKVDLASALPSFQCKNTYEFDGPIDCTKIKAPAAAETVPATLR